MAMRQLTNFSITVREEDFVLHLEADGSETLEFATPPEQLDAIIDALDELLSEADADDEPDSVESYQKPLG
jgi:hypothetical protein